MAEKNSQAGQPLNNQAQPTQIGGQIYGLPPPPYDQSFPAQGQQQQFYPVQQGPQVVTVITGGIYGPDPKVITCPSCGKLITTQVDYESSTKTHLMAVLLCLLIWPCFWLPYAMDSCKNANHLCPSCNAYLGTYNG